jgi:uncharacterized protein (DUF2252 family)
MKIQKATRQYEEWLTRYTPLIAADLDLKHRQMAEGVFPFLRGTFYRWMQLWPEVCADLAKAPVVLAVGDLHVENFGTWRDREGRLVWGINDFDEAAHLPYTLDLTRLAASAQLAIEAAHLCVQCVDACEAILAGYEAALRAGGRAFVLAEEHEWLRTIATSDLRNPVKYWSKLEALPDAPGPIPESATAAIEHTMPQPAMSYRVKQRIAGVGSLGHPRYTALTEHQGGKLAREAKALVPSAAIWAQERSGPPEIFYRAICDRAVRCQDPTVQLQGHWIVRRLAPDCSRIDLASLPQERAEARLLHAMGWETANVHLGTVGAAKAIRADLKKRPQGWLQRAADAMARATLADWEAYTTERTSPS